MRKTRIVLVGLGQRKRRRNRVVFFGYVSSAFATTTRARFAVIIIVHASVARIKTAGAF